MGEPTFNGAVNVFTHFYLDEIVKEYGLDAGTVHPVVSTMLPKQNKHLLDFLGYWCWIKNEERGGEAGLQFSINSTDDGQRDEQFRRMSLPLLEISEIANILPMPIGRKYTLNFAVTEKTILDEPTLSCLFDKRKFIVKITPIHNTATAQENHFDITTSYERYDVYEQFKTPLVNAGWDVIVFVPSKEEDSDRITCGNALLAISTDNRRDGEE